MVPALKEKEVNEDFPGEEAKKVISWKKRTLGAVQSNPPVLMKLVSSRLASLPSFFLPELSPSSSSLGVGCVSFSAPLQLLG